MTFPAVCPGFTPCGSAAVGLGLTYKYESGCADDAEFAPLLALADRQCVPAGSSTITNKAGTIQGSVNFVSPTSVARSIAGSITFTATLGGACGNAVACPQISSMLGPYGVTGTCTFDAMLVKCVCSLARTFNETSTETYTLNGNQFTTTGSKTRVYDYCTTQPGAGSTAKLDYREVTPSDGGTYLRDPGYFRLGR